jgi:carbonic anhydrase
MAIGTFATVINCIDGRANRPVINWVHLNLHLHHVDLVTEPGPDGVMSNGTPAQHDEIKRKVLVSLQAHHSGVIILAGHHDCAGNPVSEAEHRQQIAAGARAITTWNLGVRVIGLWVNDQWGIDVVSDTGSQGYVPEQFAVAVTCIDGRAKRPLADWMKQHYGVHYVDLITEAEPDTALLRGTTALLEHVQHNLRYAINAHQPTVLAIAAHHDCGGNALSASDHQTQVKRVANLMATWGLNLPIVGVWLDEQWQAHIVCEVPARSVV